MNICCKFEKASYNIFFVRAVMVKSLYTLRRRNEAKYIVSIGCYPVDTITTTLTVPDTVKTAVGRDIWSKILGKTSVKKLVNQGGCFKD